jgi:hypothetical protein
MRYNSNEGIKRKWRRKKFKYRTVREIIYQMKMVLGKNNIYNK